MLAGLNKNTSVIAYIGVGFNLILVMTSGLKAMLSLVQIYLLII